MIAVSPKPPQTGGGCMVLVVLLGSENLRISFYFERLEVTSKMCEKYLTLPPNPSQSFLVVETVALLRNCSIIVENKGILCIGSASV